MGIRTVAVHRKAAQLQAQARAGRLARCRSWRRDVPGHRIFPACPAGQVAYYALSGGVWEPMCAGPRCHAPLFTGRPMQLDTGTAPARRDRSYLEHHDHLLCALRDKDCSSTHTKGDHVLRRQHGMPNLFLPDCSRIDSMPPVAVYRDARPASTRSIVPWRQVYD